MFIHSFDVESYCCRYQIRKTEESECVRFEVFRSGTMKNAVFRDVMPCGSCKNRRISSQRASYIHYITFNTISVTHIQYN
jgi:hypothetical protein